MQCHEVKMSKYAVIAIASVLVVLCVAWNASACPPEPTPTPTQEPPTPTEKPPKVKPPMPTPTEKPPTATPTLLPTPTAGLDDSYNPPTETPKPTLIYPPAPPTLIPPATYTPPPGKAPPGKAPPQSEPTPTPAVPDGPVWLPEAGAELSWGDVILRAVGVVLGIW